MPAFWRAALELLLPSLCAGCGRSVAALPLCAACRPPPPPALPPPPAPLAAWCAAIAHEGAGADWVRRFKYPARGLAGLDAAAEGVALALIRELAPRVPGGPPDLVAPVPLHPRRLRERGFSPAALLARALARAAEAPFAAAQLARLRDTPSQTRLTRAARRRNVAGAFAARRPAPARVWLVDDVATSGATLAEAGAALRRAGAREIVGVCLAWRPPLG
jgi:predicted amidophosphoribosyltransferase